jgi:broad specificity phosphatase PhoE
MSEVLPIVYLARHGETAWTISGQHTSFTDLTLTERGERNARRLEKRLRGASFAKIFTSPLQRAKRTCELAGFGSVSQIDPDLVEWNYGEYEGRMTADIHKERPIGKCFATAARAGNHRARSARGRTGRSNVYARSKVMCCFFPAVTSCACSPLAGSAWSRAPANSSS